MNNKKLIIIVSVLLVLLIVGSLAMKLDLAHIGGEPEPAEHESFVFAMDTVMSLKAYSNDEEAATSALAQAAGAINDLEALISVTREGSDIFKINSTSDTPTTVSDETAEIISRALEICSATGGELDISIYPVLRAWGFTDAEGGYRVPEYNEIKQLLTKVDYSKIEVDGNVVTVAPGMQIDLGSVAKGYTGDMVADILTNSGIESAILDLGGNVRAVGSAPGGGDWRVGVCDPLDSSSYFGVLSVSDCSVVTSGGYNRYFVEDGRTYCHIIDPYTGYPAETEVISATIVGTDGLECDGLSTATYIMGVNKAFDFWRKTGGFDMLLVTKNGNIFITPGLEDCFELLSGYADKYTVEVVH